MSSPDTFDETAWENLITFLQEGQVIPILGRELSLMRDPESGRDILFDHWIAEKLAAKFPQNPYDKGWSLNKVVCTALRNGAKMAAINATLKRLIALHDFRVPEAHRLLAEIDCFQLYLTTAIDPMIGRALFEARAANPVVLNYGPKRFDDLPTEVERLEGPIVYHLFGRPDSAGGGAICEEDVVEWLTALQTPNHAPELLSAALESHHLLIIGLGYDGWLARFFLRAAKRHPLKDERDFQEYLADPAALADGELVLFIRSMSRSTQLVEGVLNPLEFVRELHKRWRDAARTSPAVDDNLAPKPLSRPRQPMRFLPPDREMPPGAVFISYSRGDIDVAKKLKSRCDEEGIVTWFDIDQVGAGDSFAEKIRHNIDECHYFIPILSTDALARKEAFFYEEWRWAIQRKRRMPLNAIFILPLIADGLSRGHHRIPPEFQEVDIVMMTDGAIPEALISRLKDLNSADDDCN